MNDIVNVKLGQEAPAKGTPRGSHAVGHVTEIVHPYPKQRPLRWCHGNRAGTRFKVVVTSMIRRGAAPDFPALQRFLPHSPRDIDARSGLTIRESIARIQKLVPEPSAPNKKKVEKRRFVLITAWHFSP